MDEARTERLKLALKKELSRVLEKAISKFALKEKVSRDEIIDDVINLIKEGEITITRSTDCFKYKHKGDK